MTDAFADFAAAQAEMVNATFNRVNPHFKSKYADLSAVREATMPALTKHGLAILQMPTLKDGRLVLVSRLIHKSGQVLAECEYPLTTDGKPQQVGSEITYARRYTWAALCGIASDEDDDANIAQAAPQKSPDAAAHVKKENGKYAGLTGPDTKTALLAKLKSITHDLEGMSDLDELEGFLSDNNSPIEQVQKDFPGWWDKEKSSANDFEGLKQRIERTRKRLVDDPFGGLPVLAAG